MATDWNARLVGMLHYPEALRKAQAEIDEVIGPDRVPAFEDRDRLPYVSALINETLRWRPIAILGGTPHAVIADDEYNGMCATLSSLCPSRWLSLKYRYIPKGSTVFANFA